MRYEGNIFRPPGEWKSYLLQCTVGCSHNKCTYCYMYKDKQFHIRPLKEILEDIDMAAAYYGDVRRVFLCDGDAIILRQEELLTILDRLHQVFPSLEKVTTYAGPRSTMTKTPEQLRELCEHGLTRAYLGVESGSDQVLSDVKKGVTVEEMLLAGNRLREAGIDLWAIFMLGIAGTGEPSRAHALASAELINRMQPRHVSAVTFLPRAGTPLYDDIQAGRFVEVTPEEAILEARLMLEHITYGPIHFTCNHASNYLTLKGTIPDEAPQMIAQIDQVLSGQTHLKENWFRAHEYGRSYD